MSRGVRDSSGGVSLAFPGLRLGKYQLIRRLAIGGMAEIFLARATGIEGFERLVVLKRILPQYAESSRFIRMFLQEARLAATLHHVNIAQVYDIGQVAGSYFFTMEYIHGVDVRHIFQGARAAGQRVPLEHALDVIIHTAAGLHYAHDKRGPNGQPLGLVHRDISPSNVLVGYDGGVKLVDFGIAKATHQRSETKAGTLKGKVSYMSPEQCQAEQLDRRTDIYAVGILLYELTTGTLLYNAEGDLAIMRQIVDRDVPSPSSRVPGYPAELERIVLKALRRDRTERYATALELQLELEKFAFDHRLQLSSGSLARYIGDLFGNDLDGWRRAEQAGMSLADFLTSTLAAKTTETDAPPEPGVAAAGGEEGAPAVGLALAGMTPAEEAPPKETLATALLGTGNTERILGRKARRLLFPAALAIVGCAAVMWALWPEQAPSSAARYEVPHSVAPVQAPAPTVIAPPPAQSPPAEHGTLIVQVQNAKNARIELDGRVLAQSSDRSQADRLTGRHAVVVKATGFQAFRANVAIRAGRIVELPVKLLPVPVLRRRSDSAKRSAPSGLGSPVRPVEDGIVDPLAGKR